MLRRQCDKVVARGVFKVKRFRSTNKKSCSKYLQAAQFKLADLLFYSCSVKMLLYWFDIGTAPIPRRGTKVLFINFLENPVKLKKIWSTGH